MEMKLENYESVTEKGNLVNTQRTIIFYNPTTYWSMVFVGGQEKSKKQRHRLRVVYGLCWL